MNDKAYNDYLFRVCDMREFAERYYSDDVDNFMAMLKMWVSDKIARERSPEVAQFKLQSTAEQRKEYQDE